ncbi:MAG: DEAD/DEAH box helicase, partial [Chitinophagales bacterium]
MNRPTFIEVILPLALPKLYTYAVHFEEAEKIQVGQRIIVQFGRRRIYSAIVSRIHHKKPKEYDPKFVEEIIDESPIVTLHQLQLWQWIAQYYMCTIGEVMAIALPSALKLSSESIFLYNEGADIQNIELSDDEYLIAEALEMNRELKLDDIQGILGKKNVHPIAQSLMEKRICVVKEVVLQKYKEKTVSFVALSERYSTDKALQALFDKLGKKEKQIAVLLYYLQLTPERILIEKKKLTANPTISDSSIKTLIKNEIFVEKRQTVSRLMAKNVEVKSLDNLSPAQQKALNETQAIFTEKNVAVLEGVTGSGKTHIYIKLIKEAIAKGEQVLYLLPEIALTAQIVMRLAKYFGKKVGIYHSKFNDQERVEIYQKVLKDEYKIILAARSGVFLPFQNLGLIIVDEEHERSYKQYEPAPRYHARDTAVMMSRFYDAKVLLGSATLSLETYNNVQQEKYGHVLLSERFGDAVLPEIT